MYTRSSLLLCASLSLAATSALAQKQAPAGSEMPRSSQHDSPTEPSPGPSGASSAEPAATAPTPSDKAAVSGTSGAKLGEAGSTAAPQPTTDSDSDDAATSDSDGNARKKGKGKKGKNKKDKDNRGQDGNSQNNDGQVQAAGDQATGQGEADEAQREETLDGDDDGATSSNGTLGRLRMMLQLRYKHTYVGSNAVSPAVSVAHEQRATMQESDGYDIQRAFLRYTSRPAKWVEVKFLFDVAELRHENVRQSFKLAYIQLYPTKRLEIDVGLLKRTYSLLELLPIVDHELADLGPTDSYIKDSGYGGRDLGAVIRYRPLPKRSWMMASVGAFRGDIDEGYDSHPLKLVTGRIEGFPWSHLRLGVNGAWRPKANLKMMKFEDADGEKYYAEATSMTKGVAVGADATLLFKRLQVRAEGLFGDRTEPDRPKGQNRFASAWVVVAPNFKVGSVKFVPAAKFEWLDVNPQGAGGQRLLFTGVIGVVPTKGLRFLVDVTHTRVEKNTTAMSSVDWGVGNVQEPTSTAGTFQIQCLY